MSRNVIDEEEGIFAVRRSTQDKLTYKNNISKAIDRCNYSKGTNRFKDAIESLVDTICFDIDGYKLRSEITKMERILELQKKCFIQEYYNMLGKKLLYHANRAKLKIKVREWYWNKYYRNIIQILAKHNLLFDTERKIPVIQDNKRYDDEE